MKPPTPGGHALVRWTAVLGLWLWSWTSTSGASNAQFGYRQWPTPATWNLLLISVTYEDSQNPPTVEAMDTRIFGPEGVTAYFKEASNGRFSWSKASTIQLTLPKNQRFTSWLAVTKNDTNKALTLYFSNFVAQAFATGKISLYDYEKIPKDNTSTQGELDIMVLSPPDEAHAFSQPWVSVPEPRTGRHWEGYALGMLHGTDLYTVNHELGHHCQAYTDTGDLNWSKAMDLYGRWGVENLNDGLTVMSGSPGANVHFGAWEKFRFGWSDPPIHNLRTGGIATLYPAQAGMVNGTALLHDEAVKPTECFVVEYRTPSEKLSRFDKGVPNDGLVIWHARLDDKKEPMWLADATLPTGSQRYWWMCVACDNLFFQAPGGSGGACKTWGRHVHVDDDHADYRVPNDNSTVVGEKGWRWCSKCQSLFFGPNQAASKCAMDNGTHSAAGSGQYTCPTNGLPGYPLWSGEWRRCGKCQCLFSVKGGHDYCPAGGAHQAVAGGYSYDFQMEMQRYAVGTRGAPDLFYASSSPWPGDSLTPNLAWYDGSQSTARIYVHPFHPGDNSITIEWGGTVDGWVDFAYPGLPLKTEQGSFDMPFNTIQEGLTAAAPGSTLHLKAGHSAVTARITKPLRLEGYGGFVTIGR